jgi:hypothetical protein
MRVTVGMIVEALQLDAPSSSYWPIFLPKKPDIRESLNSPRTWPRPHIGASYPNPHRHMNLTPRRVDHQPFGIQCGHLVYAEPAANDRDICTTLPPWYMLVTNDLISRRFSRLDIRCQALFSCERATFPNPAVLSLQH